MTKNNDDLDRLSSVASEYDNSLTVTNYYLEKFYNYLLLNMGCSTLKSFVPDYMDSIEFMKSLSVAIMENYKNLVDNYNLQLEKEKEVGLLLTPEQIVNMNKKKGNAFNI